MLREHLKPESVDRIYLDPPFSSNRKFNLIFARNNVKSSDSAEMDGGRGHVGIASYGCP